MTNEAVKYYSAKELGLKPGDTVKVSPAALNGHKGVQPHHALRPDQLTSRLWEITDVNHTIVFGAAVRIDRTGALLKDPAGKFVVDGFTHRYFPNSAPVFQRASADS